MGGTIRSLLSVLVLFLLPRLSSAQAFPHLPQSALAVSHGPGISPGLPLEDSSSSFQFWVGIELGYGVASSVCRSCGEEGTQGGTSGNVLIGFVFDRNLALGLQASVWVDGAGLYEKREEKVYRTFFAVILCHYPWEDSRWFGKVGLGFAAYNAYNRYAPPLLGPAGNELPSEVHSEGGGVLVGIGYDFQIARELFLSPTLTYFYGSLGPLVLDNARSVGEQNPLNLIEVGVAFAFRSSN